MGVGKKSGDTRNRVLKVSSDLFQQNGYLATSMRDIAAAAGMKSGSLYYYYESKEALLSAILNLNIDQTLMRLEATISSLPSGASVRSKFRAAAKTNLTIILGSGDMAVASSRTLALLPEPDYAEQVRHRQAYNDFWRNLLMEGKKNGEIKSGLSDAFASMFIIGAMSFIPEWYDSKRSSSDEIAEYYTKLFFDGVAAKKRRGHASDKA
jgi:AcrR family transcriptional regulator